MKKIDSSLLVCSAAFSQQLIALGVLPVACMCYESTGGVWDFAGEYVGQSPVLPAWTMAELHILIGGDMPKPDLFNKQDWARGLNMMNWPVYFPKKMKAYNNGADAAAAWLEFILVEKLVKVEDCNARLEAFINKTFFNPMTEQLEKEGR